MDVIVSTIGFPLVGGPAGTMEGGRQAEIAQGILASKNVPYFVAAPLLIQVSSSRHLGCRQVCQGKEVQATKAAFHLGRCGQQRGWSLHLIAKLAACRLRAQPAGLQTALLPCRACSHHPAQTQQGLCDQRCAVHSA